MSTTAARPSAGALADFDGFAAALAGWFEVQPGSWRPDDLLADRLAWDSLAQVEVVEWLAAHGTELPDDLVAELRTLGDLHHYATTPGTRIDDAEGSGRHRAAVLRPVEPADHAALFALLTRGEHLTRFRLRGITPSPDGFQRQLWDRVLTQFGVRHGPNGRLVGLVSAFEADLRNRHVHIAAVADPELVGTGVVAEATIAFVDYLFTTFDLRKVYAEALSGNAARFASGIGRRFQLEGRLVDHEYVDGAYEDLLILSVTRDAWRRADRTGGAGAVGHRKADQGAHPSE